MTTRHILRRSRVVNVLQDTPELTNAELAAVFDQDEKYMGDRIRVMEIDGYVVRGRGKKLGTRTLVTWCAAPLQPQPKRRDPATYKAPPRKRIDPSRRAPVLEQPYDGQVVVERPAPNRDRHIVAQAVAQMSPLEAAWMGRAA